MDGIGHLPKVKYQKKTLLRSKFIDVSDSTSELKSNCGGWSEQRHLKKTREYVLSDLLADLGTIS
jgi:hypothetical protein